MKSTNQIYYIIGIVLLSITIYPLNLDTEKKSVTNEKYNKFLEKKTQDSEKFNPNNSVLISKEKNINNNFVSNKFQNTIQINI